MQPRQKQIQHHVQLPVLYSFRIQLIPGFLQTLRRPSDLKMLNLLSSLKTIDFQKLWDLKIWFLAIKCLFLQLTSVMRGIRIRTRQLWPACRWVLHTISVETFLYMTKLIDAASFRALFIKKRFIQMNLFYCILNCVAHIFALHYAWIFFMLMLINILDTSQTFL